jgi:hypothetical protein
MVKIQSGTMVDEPESAVPHQHVRVANRAIDIRDVGIEPHNARGEIRIRFLNDRVVSHRPWQVVECEVQARTVSDQRVDFRIRLGSRQVRIEFGKNDLRNGKSERAANLAGHELRDQGAWPLPRRAKLEHVHAVVVGFDNSGERPTFTQRRHVSRDPDSPGSEHGGNCDT